MSCLFLAGFEELTDRFFRDLDVFAENGIDGCSVTSFITMSSGGGVSDLVNLTTGLGTLAVFCVLLSSASFAGDRRLEDGSRGGEDGIAYGSSASVFRSEYVRVSLRFLVAISSSPRRPLGRLALSGRGWLCTSLGTLRRAGGARALLLVGSFFGLARERGRDRLEGSGELDSDADVTLAVTLAAEISVVDPPPPAESPFLASVDFALAVLPYMTRRFGRESYISYGSSIAGREGRRSASVVRGGGVEIEGEAVNQFGEEGYSRILYFDFEKDAKVEPGSKIGSRLGRINPLPKVRHLCGSERSSLGKIGAIGESGKTLAESCDGSMRVECTFRF